MAGIEKKGRRTEDVRSTAGQGAKELRFKPDAHT